ncbi:MAG: ketopantoate reductase family protein, partial [Gemmatimonadetes bacterium]|nr:ketopantoate reductase family protein [Gemmatimonadota bacterium]NIT87009.1 ketopantoate reductase family protein [Gemmatimonadota bacterium]NIU30848.1 ketopantoate reductase family protein [Gemmatimonadota bacterium]NIU35617.1 ketopantoate reductase family protein [Gemmatimonadota bacterium]NIV61215.1 ketopantoate reductase family protein [Gemmatimonadota bacterium]
AASSPTRVLTDNIFGYLWGKLAYAALLFATALTDASIADVLAEERFRPSLIALAREVVEVAEARGVSLEGFDGFDPAAFRTDAPEGRAEA